METTYKCSDCPLRTKYDRKPKSLLGRFWRFHIRFCPGWKAYIKSLSSEEYGELKIKYHIK